ncbi:hypothetical protein PoB_005542900 [Plakobranchus ocellatus]|uniref:Uncharacterized protein n=1 Tax=Plakobranchus ocellatus TaxID=259542 RepID=A0AAV4C8N7_9GAST|nr:hypothetical protein PoB_005542900 [Plakobranchus ocellatus]
MPNFKCVCILTKDLSLAEQTKVNYNTKSPQKSTIPLTVHWSKTEWITAWSFHVSFTWSMVVDKIPVVSSDCYCVGAGQVRTRTAGHKGGCASPCGTKLDLEIVSFAATTTNV